MSRENVEAVRRAFVAFNQSDADGMIAVCTPDVEFEPIVAGVEGQTHRGGEGIRAWLAQMNEIFEEYHAEHHEIEALGEVVLVRGVTTGRGRGSGVPTARPWTLGIRFKGGKADFWAFRQSRSRWGDRGLRGSAVGNRGGGPSQNPRRCCAGSLCVDQLQRPRATCVLRSREATACAR